MEFKYNKRDYETLKKIGEIHTISVPEYIALILMSHCKFIRKIEEYIDNSEHTMDMSALNISEMDECTKKAIMLKLCDISYLSDDYINNEARYIFDMIKKDNSIFDSEMVRENIYEMVKAFKNNQSQS